MSSIKVMTFNIRGATFEDDDNRWEHRAELNCDVIRSADPDVIGFQEFQDGNHATYLSAFGEHFASAFGQVYNRPGRKMYNAIYWRESRFSLLNSGSLYLSETPEVWSSSWDAARVHTVSWVILREIVTGEGFCVLNTHLDHGSEWARRESAKQIGALAGSEFGELRTVLVGDFNSSSSVRDPESVYETFLAAGFADTLDEATYPEPFHTFHGFHGLKFDPKTRTDQSLRLDWVLIRGDFAGNGCRIIRDEAPPLQSSDHYPVMATLRFV